MMRMMMRNLRRDERGSTLIESAFLLPVFVLMLIGVVQASLYVQAQNALRGISGELGRYMVVQSEKSNAKGLTNEQIETQAMGVAIEAPYLLRSEDLQIDITDATTQNIQRVRQIDIKFTYEVPDLLGFANVAPLTLTYTRQLFVPQ